MRLPPALARALHGQTFYTNLEILPALMLERGPDPNSPEYAAWAREHADEMPHPLPVKTVPPHHSPVRMATGGDIAEIFGDPSKKATSSSGTPANRVIPVCIDLKNSSSARREFLAQPAQASRSSPASSWPV